MALFDPSHKRIVDRVQINIPFTWLVEDNWLDIYLENEIHPEIGIDAAALDKYSLSDFAEVAKAFHDINRTITLHGPFLDLSPGSPDPDVREVARKRINQAIAAAEVFAPRSLVCHAGYDPSRYDFIREKWLDAAVETWSRAGRQLHRIGCRLMLENVYETDPNQLLMVFEKLDYGYFGCCLDIGHLSVFGKHPLSKWIKDLSPYIGQLHLHDNDGSFDQHLGLGQGSIDKQPLAELFSSEPNTLVVTLEPHSKEDLMASIHFLSDLEWFR